jgi:hypothetical protein
MKIVNSLESLKTETFYGVSLSEKLFKLLHTWIIVSYRLKLIETKFLVFEKSL